MKKLTLSGKTKKNIFVYLLIAYPIIQFAIFYVGVNASTILMAFQTVKGGEVVFAGLTNFKEVFNKFTADPLFYTSAINSIKMTVICFISLALEKERSCFLCMKFLPRMKDIPVL